MNLHGVWKDGMNRHWIMTCTQLRLFGLRCIFIRKPKLGGVCMGLSMQSPSSSKIRVKLRSFNMIDGIIHIVRWMWCAIKARYEYRI